MANRGERAGIAAETWPSCGRASTSPRRGAFGVTSTEASIAARSASEIDTVHGPFARAFAHVEFAVLDRHGDTIARFAEVFSAANGGDNRGDAHARP